MRKKRKAAVSHGNVIIFPGTLERLKRQAAEALQKELYSDAVEYLHEMMEVDPSERSYYDQLAVCYYELKEFEKAKEFALLAMQNEVGDYIKMLELYLSILIQLQQYDEVEMMIQGLLEKQIIPQDSMQKFKYLRELNGRLAKRYDEEAQHGQQPAIEAETFFSMSSEKQQDVLLSLQHGQLSGCIPLLTAIAEKEDSDLAVKTYALLLLQQSGSSQPVTVKKLHFEAQVNPASLTAPENDQFVSEVLFLAQSQFDKDPTAGELAGHLIMKYSVLLYPFHWASYAAEEVADAYAEYVRALLYEKQPEDTELLKFIRSVDEEMNSI